MVFTALYNGKIISIPVNAGNNSSITSIDNVKITFNIPSGIIYTSSNLPIGSYDIENNEWLVGTITPLTTHQGVIDFMVIDEDNFLGGETSITWEITTTPPYDDYVPQNNEGAYTLNVASCSEIENCFGCDFDDVIYECKRFTVPITVNNITTDIVEDLEVDLYIPSGYKIKSATATYGTPNLGMNPAGSISSVTISDNTCSGTYYEHLKWVIPTLPTLTIAEMSVVVYAIIPAQITSCDEISWEITHDVSNSVFNGITGKYKLKGISGENLVNAFGYKEWAGKLIYSALPISTPLGFAIGYIALPYNRGSFNYLGDLDLNFVGAGQFNLLGDGTFFTSKVVMLKGGHGATSEDIAITTYVDADNLDFTTNGLVDEIDNDVVIRVYY